MKARILVVDDEAEIRRSVRMILEYEGYDVQEAAKEMHRLAAKGVHAVTFSEIPPFLGFPSIHDKDGYWDPFLRACEETQTVICLHNGSSSWTAARSPGADFAIGASVNAAMGLSAGSLAMALSS